MTNTEIIVANMFILINEGTLTADEEIHTFQGWKARGYSVKKGEKCITKFPIWKNVTYKAEDGTTKDRMIMKNSCWFSTKQVQEATK